MSADIRTAAQNFMTALGGLMDAFSAQVAEPKTLYSPAEVAEILCVSPDTVRAAIRAGEFGDTVHPDKSRHLITAQGLQGYIATHTGPVESSQKPRARKKGFRPCGESRAYLIWTI